LHARDDVHRHLVDVLGQVHDRVADAEELALTCAAAALKIGIGDLAPELAERGPLGGIGDDDEVPRLCVARRRRLLRELQALLEHLALDRPAQVEPLADGARGREQLVRRQLERRHRTHASPPERGRADTRDERLSVHAFVPISVPMRHLTTWYALAALLVTALGAVAAPSATYASVSWSLAGFASLGAILYGLRTFRPPRPRAWHLL